MVWNNVKQRYVLFGLVIVVIVVLIVNVSHTSLSSHVFPHRSSAAVSQSLTSPMIPVKRWKDTIDQRLQSISGYFLNRTGSENTGASNEERETTFSSPYIHLDSHINPYRLHAGEERQHTAEAPREKIVISMVNKPSWLFTSFDFSQCVVPECEYDPYGKKISQSRLVLVYAVGLHIPPPKRQPNQIWAYLVWESPVHTGGIAGNKQWRDQFNWTITYRTDADIFSPCGELHERTVLPDKDYEAITRNKTGLAAWFVSNCNTQSKREEYVNEMKRYIDVDIYGNCGRMQCSKSTRSECFALLSRKYLFYLSFENSLCEGYVSEKFFNVFRDINAVPVVRGGTDYDKYFPRDILINAKHFPSPKSLALHLLSYKDDVKKYSELLRRKDKYVRYYNGVFDMCRLCKVMHEPISPKRYENADDWIKKGRCHAPDDIVIS